jgi:hypothetical protein
MSVYKSIVSDISHLDSVITNESFMLQLLKTLKTNTILYLTPANTRDEYELILSSMKLIEYYVMVSFPEFYIKNYKTISKLDMNELKKTYSFNMTRENMIYPNKNYWFKNLFVSIAEKIALFLQNKNNE